MFEIEKYFGFWNAQSDSVAQRRAAILLSTIVTLVVTGFIVFTGYLSVQERDRANFTALDGITQLIELHMTAVDFQGVRSVSKLALERPELAQIVVVDSFGYPVFGNLTNLMQESDDNSYGTQVVIKEIHASSESNPSFGGSETLGKAYFLKLLPDYNELFWNAVLNAIIAFATVFTCCLFLVNHYVSRYITVPMVQISNAIRETLRTGDHIRVGYSSDTAMGKFASSFDLMQSELESNREKQQQLIAQNKQISKELKQSYLELKSEEQKRKEQLTLLGEIFRIVDLSISYFNKDNELIYSNADHRSSALVSKLLAEPIRSSEELMHFSDQQGIDCSILVSLGEEDEVGYPTKFYHADLTDETGNIWYTQAFGLSNSSLAMICVGVTEQRLLQQKAQHSNKLEALGSLTSGVTHEFNNMLAIMISNAELEMHVPSDGDLRNQRLQAILDAGERATSTVAQLLNYSRKAPVKTETLNLKVHFEKLKEMLQTIMGPHIQLSMHAAEDCFVNVEPDQFDSAIVNFASNARDAMFKGGTLYINSYLQSNQAKSDNEAIKNHSIVISIKDTGEGIEKADLDRIFDPFFTTKAPGKGVGLGLATVYGFIKRSGGKIEVFSKKGEGTEFKITLPSVKESNCKNELIDNSNNISIQGIRCLVVDDEGAMLKVITEALTQQGCQVEIASSIKEAGKKINNNRFDVVICDLSLKDGNSNQLLEKINDSKIISMSGNPQAHPEVYDNSDVVLVKPFQMTKLFQEIDSLLG